MARSRIPNWFENNRQNRWRIREAQRREEVNPEPPVESLPETPTDAGQDRDPGGLWVLDTDGAIQPLEPSTDPVVATQPTQYYSVTDASGEAYAVLGIRRSRPPEPNRHQVEVDFESSARIADLSVDRPPGYWKMRNGRFIALIHMEDSHLNNTIEMLRRNANARGRILSPTGPGPYAELIAEVRRRADTRQQEANRIAALRMIQEQMNGAEQSWVARVPAFSSDVERVAFFGMGAPASVGMGREETVGFTQAQDPPQELDRPQGRRIKS